MQSNSNIPVKDKTRNILTTEEEQKARCFTEVLNQPEPTIMFDFDSLTIPTELELCVDMSDIKEEETAKAIRALKNNKAVELLTSYQPNL